MLIRITLIYIIPFGRIDIFIIVFPSKDGTLMHLLLFCFMSSGSVCTVLLICALFILLLLYSFCHFCEWSIFSICICKCYYCCRKKLLIQEYLPCMQQMDYFSEYTDHIYHSFNNYLSSTLSSTRDRAVDKTCKTSALMELMLSCLWNQRGKYGPDHGG